MKKPRPEQVIAKSRPTSLAWHPPDFQSAILPAPNRTVILSQRARWRENPPDVQSAKSLRLLSATGKRMCGFESAGTVLKAGQLDNR